MKSAVPKQFLPLAGRPLLMHTLERFHTFDSSMEIILVLPGGHHSLWKKLCSDHSFTVSHQVVAGGEERFHSVRAGLAAVAVSAGAAFAPGISADYAEKGPGAAFAPGISAGCAEGGPGAGADNSTAAPDDILVAIHDGVRPLVSHDTLWRCFADAEEFGNAVPFIEPADSVRVLDGDNSRPVPRSEVRLIQTPQVFRGSVIIKAYNRGFDPSFTDDATVAEADGVAIHLTHGNRENIKITTPGDLAVAETLAGMLRQ